MKLLDSVYKQTLVPDEILVIDGSYDEETKVLLKKPNLPGLKYFKVGVEERGLTRQRNYGVTKTGKDIGVICFLDDDIILDQEYFQNLINTYEEFPDAIGVGGYIMEEVKWERTENSPSYSEFKIDGWTRKLGSRHLFRKRLGLFSTKPPGVMPDFSNGLSTGFLPPSGKTYPVEYFMGGVASYKKELFDRIGFSSYFEGYGLYEDMDFCLRTSRRGQLYVNTAAKVHHYHEEGGRPNKFRYGKMVVRNGWYVWRVKYPNPTVKAKLKWIVVAVLLLSVRCGNVLSSKNKKEVILECFGRKAGLISLIFHKPHLR